MEENMVDETSSKKDDVTKATVDGSEVNEKPKKEAAEADETVEQVAATFDDTGDSASLETQLEELKEALLRSQADIQNGRRRAERDIKLCDYLSPFSPGAYKSCIGAGAECEFKSI